MTKAKDSSRQSGCPIAFTLDILGDKWSLLIIRDMVFLGKKYYGDFLDSGEGIASNILADRLKRMGAQGIISRTDNPNNKKQAIYSLTEKGIDLLPVILEMILWGAKHDPNTAAPPEFLRKLNKDRSAVLREIVDGLKKSKKFLKL